MTETASRRDRIIQIFHEYGEPPTVPALTAECIRQGVWTKQDRDKLLFHGAQSTVRNVLNSTDINGLPVSLIRDVVIEETDGDKAPVRLRVQPEFWTEADARTWIRSRVRQLRQDYEKLSATIDYLSKRFPATDWWDLVDLPWQENEQTTT